MGGSGMRQTDGGRFAQIAPIALVTFGSVVVVAATTALCGIATQSACTLYICEV